MSRRGYTLIELMVYVALLALLLASALQIVTLMLRSSSGVEGDRALLRGGESAMERMTQVIRAASAVNVASSTFGENPGDLSLEVVDLQGATSTIEFSVFEGRVAVSENGGAPEPLIEPSLRTPALFFDALATDHSQAVRIRMTLAASSSTSTIERTFYDTIVLRGSY